MRTRSAQKAYMRITRWFPNEVLTAIIDNAARADQATLCRVSTLFHALALPVLNRRVILRTDYTEPEVLEAFCNAIIRNLARADSVRSFTFINEPSVVLVEDFLIQSLKLMTRLEHLFIDDFRPRGVVSRLADIDFPNLWSCTLEFHAEAWEQHVAKFLARHPTIMHLRLQTWAAEGEHLMPEGTLLPELQYYHGPLHLLSGFSKHSLQAVRTSWTGRETSSFMENLSAQTGLDLASLSLYYLDAAEVSDVLIHLSKHMPHLEKLELHFWDAPTSTAVIVNDVNAFQRRFKRLAYLAMAFSSLDESHYAVVESDNERRAFEMWTNASLSLRGCCIGQTAWRKVGQKWEDCSKKLFRSEAGFEVFDQLSMVDND
ncbi:hypothetical protein FB45DRAFT_1062991 [Roridomyces roridus]|uniref:Uncharacterized protein n=1 Tax=Roridomyces roridus TaxID=1738132 RepID=A0AAD7FH34_9AGAR|nr:hypothetical protein FB45DRAFT_1062991 [Roridomyces roridus]